MSSRDLPPPTSGGIQLSGVVKSFGDVYAVRGIDLSIAPGETVALLGPNGAGKSTTIDMLLGLQHPDAGSITVFGATPQQAITDGYIAAMLQTGSLIQNTRVRELVELMASLYPNPRDVDETIEIAGLTPLAAKWTEKLSGGEAQRVRFACALVANADVLVLDEPTVALDVEARHSFWTTMRRVAAIGTTIIFATHYLEEADASADRIVLMAQGRIVADGSTTEIASMVGGRTMRATLPHVEIAELARVAGVRNAERHGDSIVLECDDSDRALRVLLAEHPAISDIEIRGAGLEAAFLELTTEASR